MNESFVKLVHEKHIWEVIDKSCQIFNKFEEIVLTLSELSEQKKIKNLLINSLGKFTFSVEIQKVSGFSLLFYLAMDHNLNCHLTYQSETKKSTFMRGEKLIAQLNQIKGSIK